MEQCSTLLFVTLLLLKFFTPEGPSDRIVERLFEDRGTDAGSSCQCLFRKLCFASCPVLMGPSSLHKAICRTNRGADSCEIVGSCLTNCRALSEMPKIRSQSYLGMCPSPSTTLCFASSACFGSSCLAAMSTSVTLFHAAALRQARCHLGAGLPQLGLIDGPSCSA